MFHDFLNVNDKVAFDSKKVMLNLGYDPDEYFFNEEDRNVIRKELNVDSNEIVIITSTRINKRKNIEQIIELISKLNNKGKNVSYVIVGFLNDAYEKEVKSFIGKQPFPNKFKCFPFLNSKEIRKLYCASDIGIWLKAAISIQEAMGTGLPIILENKPSVNHLINEGTNGWFFNKDSFEATINKVVDDLCNTALDRENLAIQNSKVLSYDTIAQKILDTVISK